MKKPNKALLKQTCETGDDVKFVDLFNKLSPGDKQSAIEEDNYLIFHLAVANGNAQIANFILEYVQKSTDLIPQEEAVIPLLKSRNHESFVIALENDHREVVDLLLSQDFFFNPCVIIISQNPNLYHKLFSLNLQNLAKYIFSYTCGLNLKNLKALLEVTPAECRQTILENTRTRLQVVSNVYAVDEPGFVKACTSRKADIVEFLWNLYHDEFKNLLKDKFFALCIQEVAKNGEVSIFNFLISQLNPEEKRAVLRSEDFATFIYAADHGQLPILKQIVEFLTEDLLMKALMAFNYAGYRHAKNNGHTEVVKYLESLASEELISKMRAAHLKTQS